ncbi:Gfo/Idh/MocA family protein [Adhaeribacter pallidiroseus]|uniref:2-hydroxy-4-carboxymuconate semialdehyde hemiacetal dehydrogenase n=1 Tax=Adhaeribacter pallidiroseus TaxID=2072847 RepID=A0A369QGL7_9BACT|nr:Gfo/Idh/MocA family oxidoreductase [Adhaeribacter pallidiroseus]RDC62039.1 2-hydroxy-4-carboxymuconate semialdehyde hemiacetal dehydrogenase [Adhaeribacter pallidiroseus]
MAYFVNRRDFIRKSSHLLAATAATSLLPGTLLAQKAAPKVRLGFIGVGLRGRNHVHNALAFPEVTITAICDTDPAAIAATQKMLREAGHKEAKVYNKNDHDFENLVKRDDVDGVIIATPWEWHVPMALAAMNARKYAGVEVSATVKLEESWALVDTFEKTGSHCMILENVCYRRDVMAVLNMVRQNLFGEITHLQCGYQHDLRGIKFNDGKQPPGVGVEFGPKAFSEAKWRTQHSIDRNGDIYPTHGLGPVAEMININRGNQFLYLTSMASKGLGLHKYIVDNGGENHPNAQVKFKLGDVVQTMIKCANGETILITHDTNSPRPYSLGFRVQGTNGLWMDDGNQIYIEKVSKTNDEWEPADPYLKKYDHKVWQQFEKVAEGAGHGGMDYFVMRDFVEAVKNKTAPPIDVYDAAAWSAISPLSEQSIAQNSASIPIPDFTRGKWKTRKPVFAV